MAQPSKLPRTTGKSALQGHSNTHLQSKLMKLKNCVPVRIAVPQPTAAAAQAVACTLAALQARFLQGTKGGHKLFGTGKEPEERNRRIARVRKLAAP